MVTNPFDKQFAQINGIRTAYTMIGTGEPAMVFVHGWSLDMECWRPQIEYFAKQRQVYAYDWRGMGQTEGGDVSYEFDQLIDDLRVFLATLKIQNPVLIGHSQGANLVLYYASMYPDEVTALIIADAPSSYSLSTNPMNFMATKSTMGFAELLKPNIPLEPLLPVYETVFYSFRYRKTNPSAIQAWKQQFVKNPVHSLINGLQATVYRQKISDSLEKIKAKTLILRGSEDVLVLGPEAKGYQTRIPGAALHTIEGSGHMTLEEKPDEFNATIDAFLKQAL